MTDIRPDTSALKPYLKGEWCLIPLHRWDAKDQRNGKVRDRGKSPLHPNWTKREYNNKDQIKHMENGGNVGVRLRACDLVIDVDPRNFKEGDDPLMRLCNDTGINRSLYPTVETGSGGFHIYMSKPEDISVRDSLSDYEGVEFKTLGRQVVSAGSVHPVTKKQYEWDFLSPELTAQLEPAPVKLLAIIKRPLAITATGGGEHEPEELATMLDALEPEDFRDQNEWLTLMQACHHATGGEGRAEFIEWSTRDPEFSDHGGIIGRRWDSLHADNKGGKRVTFRTLHKILHDKGKSQAIPGSRAEDDFDEVGPADLPPGALPPGTPTHEKPSMLDDALERYFGVMEGSTFKVAWQVQDLLTENQLYWQRVRFHDFSLMLANKKLQKGKSMVPLSDVWLNHKKRVTFRGIVFDPERDRPGLLNLWNGWGVEPSRRGSWNYLRELLFEVLCNGDDMVFDYVIKWAAHLVQHPATPAEVAICFQGGKGVGKGTWGRALTTLAGQHGKQITSSEQLTGRFNDHLRDTIVLFADEALKPYDKEGESRLKGLITEPIIAFEGKGKDVQRGRNMLHIVMASNEDWFIPAGLDGERRFMLTQANTKWKGKHGKFQKLHDELEAGGYAALLFDLLAHDLGRWAPREGIPVTSGLVTQKLMNMNACAAWWFNCLTNGKPPAEPTRDDMDWEKGPVRIFRHDIRMSYEAHCRNNNVRSGSMGRSLDIQFAAEIIKLVPELRTKLREPVPEDRPDVPENADGRARAFEFPSLSDCREMMEVALGGKIDWADEEE